MGVYPGCVGARCVGFGCLYVCACVRVCGCGCVCVSCVEVTVRVQVGMGLLWCLGMGGGCVFSSRWLKRFLVLVWRISIRSGTEPLRGVSQLPVDLDFFVSGAAWMLGACLLYCCCCGATSPTHSRTHMQTCTECFQARTHIHTHAHNRKQRTAATPFTISTSMRRRAASATSLCSSCGHPTPPRLRRRCLYVVCARSLGVFAWGCVLSQFG